MTNKNEGSRRVDFYLVHGGSKKPKANNVIACLRFRCHGVTKISFLLAILKKYDSSMKCYVMSEALSIYLKYLVSNYTNMYRKKSEVAIYKIKAAHIVKN